MVSSVTTHSSFTKSVVMSVAVSVVGLGVWELFFVEPEVKIQ